MHCGQRSASEHWHTFVALKPWINNSLSISNMGWENLCTSIAPLKPHISFMESTWKPHNYSIGLVWDACMPGYRTIIQHCYSIQWNRIGFTKLFMYIDDLLMAFVSSISCPKTARHKGKPFAVSLVYAALTSGIDIAVRYMKMCNNKNHNSIQQHKYAYKLLHWNVTTKQLLCYLLKKKKKCYPPTISL